LFEEASEKEKKKKAGEEKKGATKKPIRTPNRSRGREERKRGEKSRQLQSSSTTSSDVSEAEGRAILTRGLEKKVPSKVLVVLMQGGRSERRRKSRRRARGFLVGSPPLDRDGWGSHASIGLPKVLTTVD